MADNILAKVFDNIASRTVLALLGIIGATITIYAFFQDQKADLRYEIIANTNVLDINADLSKLEIIYDSTNLKQTGENLRIFTVKVVNIGNQHITKEYYDENDPVGIKMSTGEIIEKPEIIKTSNDYLKRKLKITEYGKERITLSQVILESGEYIIIKLLVLHNKETIPQILSIGKIVGQKEIDVVNAIDIKEEQTFLKTTFQGGIWNQLLRLIAYFFGAALLIGLMIFSSERIDDYREKKRKNKMVHSFKNKKSYVYTRMDDAVFDRYKKSSFYSLNEMQSLLDDEEELNRTYKKLSDRLKNKEYSRYRRTEGVNIYYGGDDDNWATIKDMISDGFIIKDQDSLSINQAMKDTLGKFVSYLVEKGEMEASKNARIVHAKTQILNQMESENE